MPEREADAARFAAAHGLRIAAERPEIPGGGPQSAAAALDRALACEPGSEALVGRHGRQSYAELDDAANRAARALAELGVRAGDRVAACLPNDVDLVVAFLACMRMGAIWVGVHRALAPPERAHVLRDSGAAVLLAAPDAARALRPHRATLPDLAHAVVVDPGGRQDAWRARLAAAAGAGRPAAASDPLAPAAAAYTGSTSGTA